MNDFVFLLLFFGGTAVSFITFLGLIEIIYKLKDLLNHTIFKEKYKKEIIDSITSAIEFNNYKIAIYKGESKHQDKYDEIAEYCAICRHCPSEFYLSEGIDKDLVNEFKESEIKANELYYIYEEECKKKDVQKRLEFIESELKDLKKINNN